MPNRMTAIDAQFYWMSAKIPSDEFLLYAFDGLPTDFGHAINEVCTRANASRALTVRVEDGSPLTYPRWVPTTVEADRIVRHDLDDNSWQGCLDAVGRLFDDQLDIRRAPWRMHLFGRCTVLRAAPDRPPSRSCSSRTRCTVFGRPPSGMQLADGMAAWLFGRETPVPKLVPESRGFLPWLAFDAARAQRKLVSDTRAGLLPPAIGPQPALCTNTHPTGARPMRTLVRHRSQLRGQTATVAVLAAASGALSGQFGDVVSSLAAEVTMAKPGVPHAHNHFANATIGLYPNLDRQARIAKIATDLTNARLRSEHPAFRAADRAFAATPAPLLRWGASLFDPEVQPARVAGNTVVSSIYRVPVDLTFGAVPVLLTAVFPGLSSVIGLTHGVWGMGDTVTVSVHAAESAVGDIDDYMARLDAEL